MEDFGFAMGPLAVRDLAGNDVGFLIRKGRRLPPDERWSPILERLVAEGRLGQKSGKGFYRYEGRTRIADPQVTALIEAVSRERGIERRQIPDAEILERLLHPLVNEGARIVDEGIAIRASDIDVVYVNGYGFPAYKGGPMFWAEQAGLERVVRTMQRLAPTHGARWRPAPLLERLVAEGRGWGSGDGEEGTCRRDSQQRQWRCRWCWPLRRAPTPRPASMPRRTCRARSRSGRAARVSSRVWAIFTAQ